MLTAKKKHFSYFISAPPPNGSDRLNQRPQFETMPCSEGESTLGIGNQKQTTIPIYLLTLIVLDRTEDQTICLFISHRFIGAAGLALGTDTGGDVDDDLDVADGGPPLV